MGRRFTTPCNGKKKNVKCITTITLLVAVCVGGSARTYTINQRFAVATVTHAELHAFASDGASGVKLPYLNLGVGTQMLENNVK